MNRPAITVENIGKRYKIGAREKANRTLRETIVDAVAAPWKRFRFLRERVDGDETIWALRDVSFGVERWYYPVNHCNAGYYYYRK